VKFSTCIARLRASIDRPLPGLDAQAVMAPRPARQWPPGFDPARARRAAGLVLLYPRDDRAHIVLTLRADFLGRHSGQVSLPGGALDPGETFEQAALREAHEEVGLEPDTVRTLGALTPLDIQVSGFRLHPILAAMSDRPALRPANAEVARILEVPVSMLMDPSTVVWRSLTREGRRYDVPVFVVDGADVWGATAMVLAEFLALLGWKGI
jgi:8-oxo-dGTP pyrophosphatase MutT (NUDIX family)